MGCFFGKKSVCKDERRGLSMEDNAIIQLYWARDEGAIAASEKKYGGY